MLGWTWLTVYPKKYAHGFCFAVLCCGYTLTDFPISIRLTSQALWQSNDCPSASKATLMNMDKYFMWIHYERLHNHNKAKHNKTVCIFLGIYCTLLWGVELYGVMWDELLILNGSSVSMSSMTIRCLDWPFNGMQQKTLSHMLGRASQLATYGRVLCVDGWVGGCSGGVATQWVLLVLVIKIVMLETMNDNAIIYKLQDIVTSSSILLAEVVFQFAKTNQLFSQ